VAPGTGEPAPVSEVTVAEEPVPVVTDCDASYPDLCIPPAPPYLNCDYVYGLGMSHITVYAPDPHGFDGNGDDVGCEG
jgi:micrococcal nuclease